MMLKHKELSFNYEGARSNTNDLHDAPGDKVKLSNDAGALGVGMGSKTATIAMPMKQKIMANAGDISKLAQGQTVIDLVSDEDSWDDWGNASTADEDARDKQEASFDGGDSPDEDDSDIDDGEITHDNFTLSGHDNVESIQTDVAPAKDRNGYEEKSSITKHFKSPKEALLSQSATTNDLGSLPASRKRKKVGKASALSSPRRQRIPPIQQSNHSVDVGKPGHQPALVLSALPKDIMGTVEVWHREKGPQPSLPFTTQHGPVSLKYGKGGRPAQFIYKDGSPLTARMHTLTVGKRRSNVIVASGANLEPSIISSTKSWDSEDKVRVCTFYRVWIGLTGDKDGFAESMPVAKCFKAGFIPEAFGAKVKAPNSSHKRIPASLNSEPILCKRSRSDSSPLYRNIQPKEGPRLQGLEIHILNNAVMLFYSKHSEAPRIRLLNACDNVEKLFAHAIAGEVFRQDAGKVNVLSIRLPGLQRPIHIVENDKEDFEKLIEAIKTLQCWSVQAGGISGSCTVEIRART
jgi:hypothetical protein